MKYAITLEAEHNRGDHAKDVSIAIEPQSGETIEGLIERVRLDNPAHHITIRCVVLATQEVPR